MNTCFVNYLLLLLYHIPSRLAGTCEVAVIVDTESNRSYEKLLTKRAAILAAEGLKCFPYPLLVRLWNPVSFSGCPHDTVYSSNIKNLRSPNSGYILSHKTIWEDYCLSRPNATVNDAILVLDGNFFCQASDCASILSNHLHSQTTDLFYYGYCYNLPQEHWDLPQCTHAYSIKCFAVRRIKDTIDPCGPALDEQLHKLVSSGSLSWDYISNFEFTKDFAAINDIELTSFGKFSFATESSYNNGLVWQIQEETERVLTRCSGQIRWSNTSGCVPKELCGNTTHLLDIPNFDGFFPASILCDRNSTGFKKIYDTKDTRACLRNKKICMLGDSTLEESIHDIAVLLSGIGINVSNVLSHYMYIQREVVPHNVTLNDVTVEMTATVGNRPHRRMNIVAPALNFSLFHLYTGHRNLDENGEGITALIYALQTLPNLQNCNILVLQSASHDYGRMRDDGCFSPTYQGPDCIETYTNHTKLIARIIATMFPRATSSTKVFWKGEPYNAYRESDKKVIYIPRNKKLIMEAAVADVFANTPIKFVNISATLAHLPTMHSNWLAHIGQYSLLTQSPLSLLWTFVASETLLNHICEYFE